MPGFDCSLQRVTALRDDFELVISTSSRRLTRETVHALRIACRRLREWVNMNAARIDRKIGKRIHRNLSELCRELSASRDRDVSLKLLASMPLSSSASRAAKALAKTLKRERGFELRIEHYQHGISPLAETLLARLPKTFSHVENRLRAVARNRGQQTHPRQKKIRCLRYAIEVTAAGGFEHIHELACTAQQAYGAVRDFTLARKLAKKRAVHSRRHPEAVCRDERFGRSRIVSPSLACARRSRPRRAPATEQLMD